MISSKLHLGRTKRHQPRHLSQIISLCANRDVHFSSHRYFEVRRHSNRFTRFRLGQIRALLAYDWLFENGIDVFPKTFCNFHIC